ncbi:hypothetical protein QL285_037121 [Trifolium repens]|jgi:hypothetical protein|nr:hypothetical protein QL285_037121 [Trifolium repens]
MIKIFKSLKMVTFRRRHCQLFDPDPKLTSTNRIVTFVITSSNVLTARWDSEVCSGGEARKTCVEQKDFPAPDEERYRLNGE